MTTKRPYRVEFRSHNTRGQWCDWVVYGTYATEKSAMALVDAKRNVPWVSPKEWRIVWTRRTVMDY